MEPLVTGAAEVLGVQLDRAQVDRFHRYYLEMVDWNSRVNLTTVTGWEQVQARHFLDSLCVSAVLPPSLLSSGAKVLDVGSGAGLPGLPLKIAFPTLRLTLMEATAKKTEFLRHVAQVLELADVDVCTGRAEAVAHDLRLRESFDLVVSRAVAGLSVLAELTLPFCRAGGLVVAHKGPDADDEIRRAGKAIGAMGGKLREVTQVAAAHSGVAGVLVVLEKVGPTPAKYPRRPGIPSKRPL